MNSDLPWSTDGVVNGYGEACEASVDGVLRQVPPLAEHEEFSLDGVTYEAFNTAGGLGTLAETLAGRVQGVVAAAIGVVPFRQDARIKLLAYTGTQRSRFLPELPTVAEAGVPGYQFDSWIGLLAPAATPKSEVDRLNAAMQKVLADPGVPRERSTDRERRAGVRRVSGGSVRAA